MINSAYFAFKAILKRRSSTFFISLIWGSGLFSIASIQRLDKGLTEGIVNQVGSTDILIAAKGSPTQSIFANIFHIDQPTGNIQNKEAERIIKEYNLKDVRRIAYGDNYLGFRILGCDSSTWNNLNYKSFEGRYPLSVNEVLIGRKVCDLTKLKIGDEFYGTHGLIGHSHESINIRFVAL
jgi:putative ABC transport system permease protein